MSFGGFYKGKRVFVTGSTGFKGSWLCHWLKMLGATIGGYALPPITSPNAWTALHLNQSVQQRMADVRDLGALRESIAQFRPQVVFHLAAQPLVRESYVDPKGTFDINVGGTVNLLDVIRGEPGIQACVVITTDKCYENREWIWGYRETDALGGHDPYSASKAAAELVVASYRRSFFASSMTRLASARAGNVIGGGDWSKDRLVVDFIRAMSAGAPLRLRNPQATRPWQHVLEPLSGYLQLARKLCAADGEACAEAWNFGPDERSVVTVETIADSLVRHWGAGRVEVQPGDHPHEAGLLKLDVSKARTRLGWNGIWDIERTIQQTVYWYQAFDSGKDPQALCERQITDYMHDAGVARQPWARLEEIAI